MSDDKKLDIQEGPQQTKTNPPKTKLGKFEVKNGSVVLLPPEDDTPAPEPAKGSQTVLEPTQDGVVVKVEDETSPTEDLAVTTKEAEEKAHSEAKKVREENQQRAEEAAVQPSPKTDDSGAIVNEGTINDVKLPEYETQEEESEEEEEEAPEQDEAQEQKDADAAFHAEVEKVLSEQSEDYEEEYYDDSDED